MSFNKIEYINKYSKDNYKTYLIKCRKNSEVFEWLNTKNNKNGYILDLIRKDINKNLYTIDKLVKNVKYDKDNKALYFGEWLDNFYNSSSYIKSLILNKEPIYINDDKVFMSYIAGATEFLSNKFKIDVPEWVNNNKYFYKGIYYAYNTKIDDFKKYLKINTPEEFKKRNLYVGENILKRV